jgi:putative mRNA 3-end processing factor
LNKVNAITNNAENWMQVRRQGLYCVPAEAYIDPHEPVERAIITHGHTDHARPGHGEVLATPQTQAIMKVRYPEDNPFRISLEYHQSHGLKNNINLWFAPAGHVLGSAQAVVEFDNHRLVVSGDYKRHDDPTCKPFEVVKCDTFVTEATFALPVFSHPKLEHEMSKVLRSLDAFPERAHLIGVYGLGKCQRVMKSLRNAGYQDPFYLHGALVGLTKLYEDFGQDFGQWIAATELKGKAREEMRGRIVLAPPSTLADRWSRSLPEMLPIMASGWMQIRARARQRRAEMALIVSDHADWNDLIRTVEETEASAVWITHGRTDALEYELRKRGIYAKALDLIGRKEDSE